MNHYEYVIHLFYEAMLNVVDVWMDVGLPEETAFRRFTA
jgi:hypothetical protein